MLAAGPRAHEPVFPWWYTLIKWALPMTVALGVAAWMGLGLTGMIAAPNLLSALGLSSAVTGAESFGTIAFFAMVVGTASSMAGLFTSLIIRGAVLFTLVENNLTITDRHCVDLEQRIGDLTTELRAINSRIDTERRDLLTEHGQALRTIGALEAVRANNAPSLRVQAQAADSDLSQQPQQQPQQSQQPPQAATTAAATTAAATTAAATTAAAQQQQQQPPSASAKAGARI